MSQVVLSEVHLLELCYQSELFALVYPRLSEASQAPSSLFRFYQIRIFFFLSESCFGVSKVSFSFCLKHSEEHSCVVPHSPVKVVDVQQHINQVHFERSIESMAWTPGRNA